MEQAENQNINNYQYNDDQAEEVEEENVVDSDELQEEIEEEMNQQALDETDIEDGAVSEEDATEE